MMIHGLTEMESFAQSLAQKARLGDVLLLKGELGVGKTAFARAFIRAWMRDENAEVPSPSFTIAQEYERKKARLLHFDLYRLSSDEELYELGLPDLFADAISLVEWPERLGEMTPDHTLTIEIFDKGGEARELRLTRGGELCEV